MADKQINDLPSGGALQDADLLVLQRGGTAYNVAGSQIAKQSDMTTAEGDINTLTTQMADAIRPYNDALYFATDLNALAIKATFVRFSPETLNIPVAQKQGYCLSIRSSANYGSQMAQTNNDDTIWVRTCQGGTWSAWRQLALKSESTTITVQIQLTLPSTVTVPANGTANLLTSVDPSTLTKSATIHGDTIPTGRTLYGAVFLWTNSSVCSMTNCLVEANNKLTLTVYNHSASAVSASAVRLLLFYR